MGAVDRLAGGPGGFTIGHEEHHTAAAGQGAVVEQVASGLERGKRVRPANGFGVAGGDDQLFARRRIPQLGERRHEPRRPTEVEQGQSVAAAARIGAQVVDKEVGGVHAQLVRVGPLTATVPHRAGLVDDEDDVVDGGCIARGRCVHPFGSQG